MTLLELLADALARLARAQDAADDGEREFAREILHDLELDFERALTRQEGA